MAFSANFKTDPRRFELEKLSDNEESNDEYDSECDPSFSIQKETNSKVSRILITKKSKPLEVVDEELIEEAEIDDAAPDVSALNENDEKIFLKCYRSSKSLAPAGELKKLKVEQCKAYLRKNGLRLTGTKGVLIQRIDEHLEILNGGGEKKYPEYSFIVNCKGDACMGDVVMFEQKVYEM